MSQFDIEKAWNVAADIEQRVLVDEFREVRIYQIRPEECLVETRMMNRPSALRYRQTGRPSSGRCSLRTS